MTGLIDVWTYGCAGALLELCLREDEAYLRLAEASVYFKIPPLALD